MVLCYCLPALAIPTRLEGQCPLALENISFIVIICSLDLWERVRDDVYLDSRVDTYVHSIEHALERERSDSCSREKH